MMANEKVRNYCLDYIKGIACIFVVFMHCEFPGILGVLVQSISRFSVPLFFMISGYFCYRKERIDYSKKIKHIGLIILSASVFYIIVTPIYQTGGVTVTFQDLAKFILFNVPPYIAPQLWFLFALFFDYLLFTLLDKLKIRKYAHHAIPVGIAVYIILAQGLHLMGVSVPNLVYRNFLIEGFPMFTLGFYIHEHKDSINISTKALALIVVATTLLCPVERWIMGRDFGVNIISFPQVIATFLFAVKNPNLGKTTFFQKVGEYLSMYVYVIHPAIMNLLAKAYRTYHFSEQNVALYLKPVLCVMISICRSR